MDTISVRYAETGACGEDLNVGFKEPAAYEILAPCRRTS